MTIKEIINKYPDKYVDIYTEGKNIVLVLDTCRIKYMNKNNNGQMKWIKIKDYQNMGTEIMVVSSNLLKNKNSVRQRLIVKQITNWKKEIQ